MSKIFCLGLHKTGTSSLGRALEFLGYKNCYGATHLRRQIGESKLMQALFSKQYEPLIDFAENYDAFNDLPWSVLYEALDDHFPDSKFILTTREDDAWLVSAKRYFGDTSSPFRLWMYGKPCLLYTSPSPRDLSTSRMPSSA